jgi:predicted enzyme related to lactoylglutathione lyase
MRYTIATLGIAAVFAASVAVRLPAAPRASTGAAIGEFVWHDLVTSNPAGARAFYGGLLGWTFEAGEGVDPGYTVIGYGGRRIGGIVQPQRRDDQAPVAQWLSYVVVGDVDRSAEAFATGGGRVFRGPLDARGDLRVAVVADAQGAPIGLASRGPARAAEDAAVPPLHDWLWMEYVAREPGPALTFYAEAVGFSSRVHATRDSFTYYLLATDRPRAGLFLSPWPLETSAWLPYVRVEDPGAMALRAQELGGRVVLDPRPGIRNGSLAIVLDPDGAPLALQKFPFDPGATP